MAPVLELDWKNPAEGRYNAAIEMTAQTNSGRNRALRDFACRRSQRNETLEERRSKMKSTRSYGVGSIAFAIVVAAWSVISAQSSTHRLTVVCDHAEATSKAESSSKVGLSTLVKFEGGTVLFDLGGESCSLEEHLDELGIDTTSIDAVVLSRNSPDQLRALAGALKAASKKAKVYVPAPVPRDLLEQAPHADIVAVSKPMNILPDAWLVGPLQRKRGGRKTAGQVLVLSQPDGLVVNVGCTHPGVISVVERVRETFGYQKIKLLAGGIHLRGTSKNDVREISLRLQQLGVKGLALSRCTGERALKIFRDEWGDRLATFDFGDTVGF